MTSHVPGKRNYTKTRASLAPSWVFSNADTHPPSQVPRRARACELDPSDFQAVLPGKVSWV